MLQDFNLTSQLTITCKGLEMGKRFSLLQARPELIPVSVV